MGLCQHRQRPAPPPAVVVNVQSVPAPTPAPPAPKPVPEALHPPPRSLQKARQQALEDLFKASIGKCPTTNKLHIQTYCPSSSKATAKVEFCQHCIKKYLQVHAGNQPEDEDD